jgi:hypothetical protein
MTPEEIQALIEATLKTQLTSSVAGVIATLTEHFDGQIGELRASLETARQPEVTEPTQPSKGKPSALEARLASLESQLNAETEARKAAEKAREDSERQHRFDQEFQASLSGYNVVPELREFLTNSLRRELSDVTEVGGKFTTKDGKLLTERVAEFMNSPAGKHFQGYEGIAGGLGSTSSSEKANPGNNGTSEAAILGAFLL